MEDIAFLTLWQAYFVAERGSEKQHPKRDFFAFPII
jgi:hypothetical protein